MGHGNRARLTVTLGGPWRLYQRTQLAGWQMLGTVQRGMEIGALALSDAGIYAQINQGAIKSLDQSKTIAALRVAT